MTAGSTRSFAIPQSGCSIPATAQAYSLNVTVVPDGPLGYLTLWPAGQPQPSVSTLNSSDGIVVANAAIVPAGAGGAVSVYVTNPTDVILDINGYFDSTAGATRIRSIPPRRAASPTRGAPTGQFGGPSMSAARARDFPIPLSSCGFRPRPRAYSLNVTVVPDRSIFGYLTTWPTGQAQPERLHAEFLDRQGGGERRDRSGGHQRIDLGVRHRPDRRDPGHQRLLRPPGSRARCRSTR